eukprot:CAMPEP_0172838970 /NCGR_PEP_ID=MMETSP1075-20121228/28245_1 /TAXON_ID=2916 /ORGANISM="Ceratium fusus, Strain PA161109" /LENGTH=78 /DNA_ID=CAMNT_0013682557 /DNA_START=515 /DNA_END=748 /DNA_ORIENTATION=+
MRRVLADRFLHAWLQQRSEFACIQMAKGLRQTEQLLCDDVRQPLSHLFGLSRDHALPQKETIGAVLLSPNLVSSSFDW